MKLEDLFYKVSQLNIADIAVWYGRIVIFSLIFALLAGMIYVLWTIAPVVAVALFLFLTGLFSYAWGMIERTNT